MKVEGDPRIRVAVLIVISLLAIGMMSVSYVVYHQYHKVSEYACYYGLPEGYANSNTMISNRPAGMQGSGNSIVNLLDLKCVPMPRSGFQCSDVHPPGIVYTRTELRGDFLATTNDLEGFVVSPSS